MYTAIFRRPTLNISMQYFADPEGGDQNGTNDIGDNPDGQGGDGQKNAKPSFDDVLKSDKAYQSEFDRRLAKAQETAKQKWEADAKAQADEAAKLAKMKADEKVEYERQKREKELNDREAAIIKRELHAEAVAQLTEKGLPAGLADILDLTGAENCKKSMEAVEKAFNEAVEKAFNEKLKGQTPRTGGGKQSEDAFLAGLGA